MENLIVLICNYGISPDKFPDGFFMGKHNAGDSA